MHKINDLHTPDLMDLIREYLNELPPLLGKYVRQLEERNARLEYVLNAATRLFGEVGSADHWLRDTEAYDKMCDALSLLEKS